MEVKQKEQFLQTKQQRREQYTVLLYKHGWIQKLNCEMAQVYFSGVMFSRATEGPLFWPPFRYTHTRFQSLLLYAGTDEQFLFCTTFFVRLRSNGRDANLY